ncbi:DUF5683 domain-containing protein [Flavihumibacter fluvii]|uniref:DUF5683 domain-containing protein n=1 Tax=Flavihumibacter fluvii TaxID=2838157 RepID=UPI001BDF53AA|nr:DUF5683 domain-containing protein [Flavihumibacter fluvii]ULQ53511.1 DUF5683 domain-containing protein [Flavihumibacter fluvii]
MKKARLIVCVLYCLLAGQVGYAQADTNKQATPKEVEAVLQADSAKKYNPRIATIRSAILPGWGQATNKKYWKIPIVYAALGITGYVFFDNVKTYNEVQYAYQVSVGKDTANYDNVADYLKPFVPDEVTSLDNYRREFRRNIDYSVLVFLLFWGLNVVDATVDAHLKDFDVSPNLSMKIKPMLPAGGLQGNTAGTGISLVFDIHKAKGKLISGIR